MKTARFVTLAAAVLINLLLAEVFAHEKVGIPLEKTQAAAAQAATHPQPAGV
jgi:hypothetical protein